MNIVHGTSSEEEKELQFRRQSNEDFYAQKRNQQQQVKDVSKRTCFKCDQTGHLAHKCPNLKPDDVETKKKSVYVQKQKSEVVTRKSTKFDSKQTWKPKMSKTDSQQTWKPVTSRLRTTQSWKTTVDATKQNQFWKPKVDVQNENVQNDSHFYKRSVSKGQTWVEKKQKVTVSDNQNENSFVKNDKYFPKLNESYCVEMPKVKQTWAKLFK
ncbi:putative transcription factor interactor and regulator CCHC(Zn) family [Helianthus anomalus]